MVASSRSSLRRPALRGDHRTSPSPSPVTADTAESPSQDSSRTKRTRVASVSDREQLQKRRRLAIKADQEEVRIPLRRRENAPENVLPASVTRAVPPFPLATQQSSSTSSPLDSPSIKPQYDQIKRIEEKARAAIQKEVTSLEKKDERRRLRSEHGGSRAKTELAQYFPAFDDMLSLEPPKQDVLTTKTRLILVDDIPDFEPGLGQLDPFGVHKPLHNVTVVPLPTVTSSTRFVAHDPLGPEVYYKAHRKSERHEKQMKNGDKERAQHEKYQLERLLDELRGPDWLKTLGITGITDTEKKRYEPKRALFTRETKALIEKFKRWKEEEKRRKTEKDQAQLDEIEAEETEAAASTSTRPKKKVNNRASSKPQSVTSSDKGLDSSKLDLLAAQQLLQEAQSANSSRKKVATGEAFVPPPEVHKPFVSFFEKRHLRDAAVGGRQRGRTILAFGKPVPDLDDEFFELPDMILTPDAIRASQRNRRRAKRNVES